MSTKSKAKSEAAGNSPSIKTKSPSKALVAALSALVGADEAVLDLTEGDHLALRALGGGGRAVVELPLGIEPSGAPVDLDIFAAAAGRVDCVTLLRPWPGIVGGDALLARLADLACDLICRVPPVAEDGLVAEAARHGLSAAARAVAGTQTVLLRFRPPALREARATTAGPRPALVVAGFYGRGNCGDEALFQTVFETFSPDFDIVVAVDKFGAVEGFETWYPYDRCEIRHQCDLDLFDEDRPIAGMMIGGGGLAVGFGGALVIEAHARGIPTFLAGVDLPGLDLPGCDPPDRAVVRGRGVVDRAQMRAYLGVFDHVMVRTRHSLEICRKLGLEADHGSDWAIRLTRDEADDIVADERRALVVLREFPLATVPFGYVEEIERLMTGLAAQGWSPAFLPFCPEDARNTAELGLTPLAPSLEHWWNPRRVKQLIGASGLVVGVGRLHPLIFAASLGVPAVSLVPPLALPSGRKSISKIDAICAEWDVPQVATVDALLKGLSPLQTSDTAARMASACRRLDRSIARMRAIMGDYLARLARERIGG